MNIGGLIGILWRGYRSATSGLRSIITTFMSLAGILMIVFGYLQDEVPVLMAVAVAMGFFGQAGFIGLYSVAARLYPTRIRATGIGWAIGLGRVGAIIGPSIAGVLIGFGWDRADRKIPWLQQRPSTPGPRLADYRRQSSGFQRGP